MSRTPVKSNFWSQRKAGVQAEAVAERVEIEELEHAREMERVEAQSDAQILEGLDLPVPESMKAGDDFSGFMAKAVPERLRRRALRQLWGSNPVLANVDGLVDYGEDFTDANLVIANIQTAYQVGKGMLKHVEQMALEEEAARDLAETPEGPDALEAQAPDAEIDPVRLPDPVAVQSSEEQPAHQAPYEFSTPLEDDTPLEGPPRRRMRFTAIAQDTQGYENAGSTQRV